MNKTIASKINAQSSISKWTIFELEKDYTEDELFAAFYEMGLRSATTEDLPKYMTSGWDWEKCIWALDSEFEKEGEKYIRGLVRPIVWSKIGVISKKRDVYKKNHWCFLLKSK